MWRVQRHLKFLGARANILSPYRSVIGRGHGHAQCFLKSYHREEQQINN